MTRFSLRSLLFVLALVIQTAAGGAAPAGTFAGQAGVSVDCAVDQSGVHRPAPLHGGHHQHHGCVLCQSCGDGAGAALSVAAGDYRLAFSDVARHGFDLEFLAALAALAGRAHQPRAPPLA